ncbi:cytochrome P450 [Cylindrobasidium torrendii FP15055 ss-10]|uniref:Cytochrome P450 n=1 Tax=Cylindrobasidium torrendii FP15055 ss-10 TaxID=1314674 RepID=A0A0D7AV85_9AGAR|nr:cytochrome P450 [Cylindrobasidium torrendii FP15055 ss-10]
MSFFVISALLLGFLVAAVVLHSRLFSRRGSPHGPNPLPLIGNVLDLIPVAGAGIYSDGRQPAAISKTQPITPATPMHILATRWALTYGAVVDINVFSQHLLFLSSPDAVQDLLEKRGAIYSDKPFMLMAGELCGCQNMVAFTAYSGQSKRQRRLLTSAFGARAIPTYEPLLQKSTAQFLDAVLSGASYARVRALAMRYAGGLTLAVVYGYVPVPLSADDNGRDPDPFIRQATECVNILQNEIASGGGIWAVDVMPWLKHLPLEHIPIIRSLPGLNFQKKARLWKAKMEDFVEAPWAFVKSSMASENPSTSFCSTLLQERQKENEKTKQDDDTFDFDLKWTANSMYSASGDTNVALVTSFFRAMSLHPGSARKAQIEIDKVTGGSRLPTLDDRTQLPYLDAVFTEVLRWACPVPLCLPHRLMEDDVYNGMHIKKGTLVIGNIWAILRDETLYPDAHAFNPERWLETDTPVSDKEFEKRRDPRAYVFGFGRRRCPGAQLVESSAWLLIAGVLATFDIGASQTPPDEVKWEGGVFRTPAEFDLDIKPRSQAAVALIHQAAQ